jgi:hypothetical protein
MNMERGPSKACATVVDIGTHERYLTYHYDGKAQVRSKAAIATR